MIAAAVALQPRTLIVAGIDLYEHPAGKYPGEATGENRYTPVHERSVELAILRRAFQEFQGELVIIGDTLREALKRPVASQAFQPDGAGWKA